MRRCEAEQLIERGKSPGFRVNLEERKGGFLRSDWFPEHDEDPFKTEEEAWQFAEEFCKYADERFVNVYVTRADNHKPVPGYKDRMLRKYGRS